MNIYSYFGIKVPLEKLLDDLKIDKYTGTFTAQLGLHAKNSGLQTLILCSNPYYVSPAWSKLDNQTIYKKIGGWLAFELQGKNKIRKNKFKKGTRFILAYIKNGGKIKIIDLTTRLIDGYLDQGYLMTGAIEESWLWEKRKIPKTAEFDDIKGIPQGHFVVLYGHDAENYFVSDPYPTGLEGKNGLYKVKKDKFLVSCLFWEATLLAVNSLTR